jgi:eukaryotic-like serine/threonine-protein kinase
MGEVWKARDTRLNRIVAIKRLHGAHTDRFAQEARAIAALNHPHICQIHDVGPDYLVLEYVDGAPLKGPLPQSEAIRLALEIASALEEAHSRGLLHRDLKPANVMVTAKGSAKLLDFGLAKLVDEPVDVTRTMDGAVVGTAAYMAPEQAEGKPLDVRSDVFSFGALLYELLSGSRAFGGTTTVQVLNAVLRSDPPALTGMPALDRIVRRCLQKEPARRFQTIADVRTALEQIGSSPAEAPPSIAVLPFTNMSADPENEYFSDGLAEEIINALTHMPGLKVIARTSAFAFKGKHEDVRRIADTLGVAHLLEGSVRKSGNRIRVTAQLIAAADGSHLWSERYDRELADIFAIQDDISQAIAGALRVTLVARPAGDRHKPKLAAYEAVLKGRHHMARITPAAFARANDAFEQAIALDPKYAEPHANLGFSYFMSAMQGFRSMRETMPLVRAEAEEALSLDPSDPSPHFLLASVAAAYEYDWKSAAEHFSAAMRGTSVPAEAHWAQASLYLQPLGRFDEAVAAMRRCVERDPINASWRAILGSHLTHAGRTDEAVRASTEAIELDEGIFAAYVTLAEAYIAMGRWQDAAAAAEKGHQIAAYDALSLGQLAGTLARLGERARADAFVAEMGDTPRPLIGRVLYHWLCEEFDQAAEWYERSINARDPFALVFADGPFGSAFRRTPHWPKLAAMMKLPPKP